jgi:hypothetical protein
MSLVNVQNELLKDCNLVDQSVCIQEEDIFFLLLSMVITITFRVHTYISID